MQYFEDYSIYVPTKRISVEDLRRAKVILDNNVPKLYRRGIHSVPIEPDSSGIEMLFKTLDPIFSKPDFEPNKLRYLMMTNSFHTFLPDQDVFYLVRERYQLQNMIGFSIMDLTCSSFLMGLEIAQSFLKDSAPNELIAIVSIQKVTNPLFRYGGDAFIIGDAAVAMILSNRLTGDKILAINNMMHTYTINLANSNTDHISGPVYWDYSNLLNLAKVLKKTVQQAGISLSQIKLFIPNNTIIENWEYLARLLKLSPKLFYLDGLKEYGHMNNCDLLLNYDLASQQNLLRKGDYYVMISLGLGGTIGCAVCKKE